MSMFSSAKKNNVFANPSREKINPDEVYGCRKSDKIEDAEFKVLESD